MIITVSKFWIQHIMQQRLYIGSELMTCLLVNAQIHLDT